MNIGLTYDLRSTYLAQGYSQEETLEFDRDDTIAAIETTLADLGHHCQRIGNGRQLVEALATGSRWDLVFNIAEGLHGIGREAQVPALLDLYQIPYTFSDPLVMALTLHKGMTKRVIRDAGLATADFQIVEQLEDLEQLTIPPPWFIKPVAEGTGKGVTPESIVRERSQLTGAVAALLARFHQPVLVESLLTGREFTVGVVGSGKDAQVIGSIEVILLGSAEQGVYSCLNKKEYEDRVEYCLVSGQDDPEVQAAEELALKSWQVLGCRDGGRIDIRSNGQKQPQFIEVNPLAGIHPEHSDLPIICNKLGIPYSELLGRIIASAEKRIRS